MTIKILKFNNFESIKKYKIVKISPENNETKIIFSQNYSDKLLVHRVLFWALLEDGQVVSAIPFDKKVIIPDFYSNKKDFDFKGYKNIDDTIIKYPPSYKQNELKITYLQSIDNHFFIDTIGTHLVIVTKNIAEIIPIHSWKLVNGVIKPYFLKSYINQDGTHFSDGSNLVSMDNIKGMTHFYNYEAAIEMKRIMNIYK
jgi:hypothetical protein